MRYFAPSRQQVSERVVDPYILDLYRGTNTYLIGFCHLREEIGSFRVDRIQELKLKAIGGNLGKGGSQRGVAVN